MTEADIRARLPHAGAMCLLDRVLDWSETSIRCGATSHSKPDHPLADGGRLLGPAAIEYAAQAAALHHSLIVPQDSPRPGLLTGASNVVFGVSRLDDVAGPLIVTAERLAGDERQALYAFALTDEAGSRLVEGRLTAIMSTSETSKDGTAAPVPG